MKDFTFTGEKRQATHVKLTFLGTRGNTLIHSRYHRRHSSLLLSCRRGRLLIDCGEDWLGRLARINPTAVLITHAHPDHAGGLKHGAPCPVYATADTWRLMARWPMSTREELKPRRQINVAGFEVQPWPVEHSLTAPAVGFKVADQGVCIFYVPDVAVLPHPEVALRGVDLYVGDGAVVYRALVRQRGRMVIGHASMITQMEWCRLGGVRRAVFTHCGSQIVRAHPGSIERLARELGRAHALDVRVARDDATMTLRRGRSSVRSRQ